jgi:Ca-activated chloride channel family protein
MIELIPDRMAVCQDQSSTVDLLIRITPPPRPPATQRPNLNLTLALDRSGSMEGPKMSLTRQAAAQVVHSLAAEDLLSLVTFDHEIETLLQHAQVCDKGPLLRRIGQIEARGTTALFGGWHRAGALGLASASPSRLNRVILLTDGAANEGETDLEVISKHVHELAQQGVQTTTLGFGAGYNENLLQSMARCGQGNHFYVESPDQLAQFFQLEMDGLMATMGTQVRLRLEAPGASVEWLAQVNLTPEGEVRLADLVNEAPMHLMVRLTLPQAVPIQATLYWHCQVEACPKSLERVLNLPIMAATQRQALPMHPEVEVHLATAMAARARHEAMASLQVGDEKKALSILKESLQIPKLEAAEWDSLNDLLRTVQRGDHDSGRKKVAMYSHGHGHGHGHGRSLLAQMPTTDVFHRANLDLRTQGALFQTPPAPGDRPWTRIEGMLRGLFYGERLGWGPKAPMGEASRLSLATAQHLLDSPFRLERLAQNLAHAPVLRASPSLQTLRNNLELGKPLDQLGGTTAGCAALRRIAPILIPHCGRPDASLWREVSLATSLTHNDNAALVSSLGYVALLWDLLAASQLPDPKWYLDRFASAIQGLETGKKYDPQARRFRGTPYLVSVFLKTVIPEARAKKLTVDQVCKGWGSGPYLLECLPTLLYILERHAHDPHEALRQATSNSLEPHSLGALVGASVGALHGPQLVWQLEPDLEEFLLLARHEWG